MSDRTFPMLIGVAAQHRPAESPVTPFDYGLMREAGVQYVRLGFRVPFTDASMTTTTPEFQEQEQALTNITLTDLLIILILTLC